MKTFVVYALLGAILLISGAHAGCDDPQLNPDDGEISAWFKNLGCKIKKGAEDLNESAKPWAEKIGNSAKELGNTVAEKYDELKNKLSDPPKKEGAQGTPVLVNTPTEKVPLAPLSGGGDLPNPPAVQTPGVPAAPAAAGERSAETLKTPFSIDDRFLFQTNECPPGQALDHTNHCREIQK